MSPEQSHPLHSIDRDHIDRMLAKTSPEDTDLVELARLMIRYEGFPGALDLQEDMLKILKLWNLTREDLHQQTRKIWENGYRPGQATEEGIGSSFDTADNEKT